MIPKDWKLFPLYGLLLEADDGLEDPVFGDATLVSREHLVKMLRNSGMKDPVVEMIGQGAWSSFLAEHWDLVPAPREHLFELAPHSLIAVRRKQPDQAERYAANVRAFLTAMVFLRGRVDKGFGGRPLDVAWSLEPKLTQLTHLAGGGAPQSAFEVQANNHVFMNPVVVRKQELRDSWRTGCVMPLPGGQHWDIHNEAPLIRLMIGPGSAGRRAALRNIAVHLANACCAPRPMEQLHAAISAMEMSLMASSFKELEEFAFSFLPRADNRSDFQAVVKARNAFIHEGRVQATEDAKKLARVGLILAYAFLDVAVGFLDSLGNAEKFYRFLRAQADAGRTAKLVGELRDSAAKIAFEEAVAKALGSSLTLTGK